jgi:N-acetyl-alpha-D-glucosaminyl L-malate synthase BshA
MKIGITCYPTFGGSGVVATELGLALAKRGDDVHFISYALPSRLNILHERVHFHEVTVTAYPLFDPYPPYTLALATKMAEVAAYEKLEVLHVHYAIPHAISAYLAKQILLSRLKVITTLHGTDITLVGRDESYLPITKFGIEVSDGVTAVSSG